MPEPANEYLERRAAEPDGDQRWIIRGLLHRRLNVIYGLPTGGKSTWTYNLADAYLAGDGVFMGEAVHVPGGPGRVAFVTTDDDGRDDVADAMEVFGRIDRVGVYELGIHERGYGLEDWREAADGLVAAGYGLVIVDNASGLLGDEESTNTDGDARRVISKMRALVQADLVVVLLTHSNNDGTFGGAAEWRKVARCIYGIHGKVPSETRTVKTMNNKDNLDPFKVRLADETGWRLARVGEPRPLRVVEDAPALPERTKRSRNRARNRERLDFMKSRDDWESVAQIAEAIGVNRSTVGRWLASLGHELRDGAVVPVSRAA